MIQSKTPSNPRRRTPYTGGVMPGPRGLKTGALPGKTPSGNSRARGQRCETCPLPQDWCACAYSRLPQLLCKLFCACSARQPTGCSIGFLGVAAVVQQLLNRIPRSSGRCAATPAARPRPSPPQGHPCRRLPPSEPSARKVSPRRGRTCRRSLPSPRGCP